MSQEHPITPAANSLLIRPSYGLVSLPEGGSPALSEIISRSLVHIQASRALATRHRIGEHELCEPDYGLVCAFAEDLRLPPEEVLKRLLLPKSGYLFPDTRIEDGRFKELLVDRETLPISSIPFIEGLVVERLFLRLQETPSGLDLSMFPNLTVLYCGWNPLTELDLSQVPNLTVLWCGENQLTELDLSQVPNLTKLECEGNQLTELDLSQVSNLTKLDCDRNQLTELDLSQVPNLTVLYCDGNQLTELDLSQVPNLTELYCDWNPLTELDISNLQNLNSLSYDEGKTRLIQRPDQNF
jgi:Leucine-rich repeat (LRR) protein